VTIKETDPVSNTSSIQNILTLQK